jgi:exodeoxyribonuclease V gamma subunit
MQQNRNVPYKIIAVLGMNLKDFPRKETVLSYDLLQKDSRIKLSTKSEEDNYLFLQVLMSVKEKLYLSYLGKNIKDNSKIPPSSVIDDLLDYIKNSSKSDIELVCNHPLHSFSRKYFNEENPLLYNYIYDESKGGEAKNVTPNNGVEDFNRIKIKDLINFFKNPFRHYYRHQLGIYYTDSEGSLQDTELFELDHLQKWNLKNELVDSSMELGEYRKKKVEKGELPLSRIGEVNLDEVKEDISGLKTRFDNIVEKRNKDRISINIIVGDFQLSGFVNQIYDDKYVNFVVSKDSSIAKYLVEFYINSILLIASGSANIKKFFISYQKTYDMTPYPIDLTQEEAMERLKKLIDYYQIGKQNILAFSTEFNWKDLLQFHEIEKKELKVNLEDLYKGPFTSKEYKMEYNAGFFDSDEVLDNLKENTINIIEILSNIKG